MKKIKSKKCKQCKQLFEPQRPLQYLCSATCTYEYARILVIKRVEKKNKENVKEIKDGLLSHKDYIQLFQKVFNTYIRMRDLNKGCISCGVTLTDKKYDCGHFLPTTYQFLRFNEDNCAGQCVHCNQHKHGSQYEYSIGLEQRIGVDRMQWLHAHRHDRIEISIPELKDKIKEYKKKIKDLK